MDVASIAERLSNAVAASDSDTAAAVAEPPSTPSIPSAPSTPGIPAPPAAAPPAATTSVVEPDLNFEDDPDELDFDKQEVPAAAAVEQAVQPPSVAAPPAPAPGTESEFDNMLPKAVETAFLKTNRGRNLLATYKAERVLKDMPNFDPATGENLGGLGFMPAPGQIKDWHARASDWDASHQEFETNPQSWVVNHFMDGNGAGIRHGAEQVLATLPTAINSAYDAAVRSGDKAAEERAITAFKSVFQPMAIEYINGLYDRARQIADPAKREQYLNGARTVEFDLTGKFRGDDQLAPPKPEDALRQREQDLDTREKNVMSWQHRNQTEVATQARTQVFQQIDSTLAKDIERAFATAGLKNTMKPFAYRAAINEYKSQIQQAVKQNQFAFRQYNFALSKVGSRHNAEQAAVDAVQVYQQAAQLAIKNTYRNVLKDLVGDTVAQNASTRATAASAASQTAPSVNGGQPPTQSIVSEARIVQLPGEDRSDFIQRRLSARLGLNGSPQ